MNDGAPQIVKTAQQVRAEIELIVLTFPRYHKYQVGSVLRAQAMEVVRMSTRAWWDTERQEEWKRLLVYAVDDLKATHQLAMDVKAFRSFAQFELLARLLNGLGKQCGGWLKQRHKGQNSQAKPAGRAQRLSSRDASSDEARL